jgi:hypothetical protein
MDKYFIRKKLKKIKYLSRFLPYILLGIFLATGCRNAEHIPPFINDDPCLHGRDTVMELSFSYDSSTADFYELLQFIEKKGIFSRLDRKQKADSATGSGMYLTKLICEEKAFESPVERWNLDGIFYKRCRLTSFKPLKVFPDLYPSFDLTQFNFTTAEEKNIAYAKLTEIRWGDPMKKWNDYFIVSGKTRIIILESQLAAFSESMNEYGRMIQQEWIDKTGR